MNKSSPGVIFSVPYEIAVVRPLRQTTLSERLEALRTAHFNTELVPQDLIYIDLCTDSGVSALSTHQLAALAGAKFVEPGMGLAAEASRSYALLVEQIQNLFGFPHVVATPQGRSAERIWSKIHLKANSVVAGNMLFPSTRLHIEMNGAKVIDVISEAAYDPTSGEPFKGNLDIDKLAALIHEQGADKVSCIYVELSVNACGGHPVSLANLRDIRALATAHKIPLFLDACRILENSFLIKEREPGFQNHTLRSIFAADSYVADRVGQVNYLWRRLNGGVPLIKPAAGHAVFVDVKAFLPHLSAAQFPAEALAAFIYHMSGIRLTKGPPLAPGQAARGVELLRLAIPARKYLQAHLDDVAEAILYAYANRGEIAGFKRIEDPARSKHEPAYFEPS